IDLSMGALQNVVLRRAMEEIRDEVRNGVGLDEAMGKHTVFTPLVLQMVTAGVESGQIDNLMGKVAEYYESEADYTIKNLSTLIEPLLLLFLGIIVGFIALAIFLPMWSMMDVVRGGH
ncbi:MAG TPA: type II secretion system F family protein, partial [Dissulfuribacter thermophilus]|nr:type II secretion system F family protein [Dissulfuribacter thermophilus]